MKINLNWTSMWAIIQKEILDSVRNKWVLAITVIFALLALLVSYFGSTASASTGEEVGFRGFDLTIFFILAIAEFLISRRRFSSWAMELLERHRLSEGLWLISSVMNT